jgi:hypothetical protein
MSRYDLLINSLLDIRVARNIGANLGQYGGDGGTIRWNGKTYLVDARNHTVRREYSTGCFGLIAWIKDGVLDYCNAGPFVSNAKMLGNIIFGLQLATLPLQIKRGEAGDYIQSLVQKLYLGDVQLPSSIVQPPQSSYASKTASVSFNPPKFLASEGRAKNLSKHVTCLFFLHEVREEPSFRPWDYLKLGHASIGVSGYSLNDPGRQKYLSVYVDTEENGRCGSSRSAPILTKDTYAKDKFTQMSTRTREKLERQETQPRPFQHKIEHPSEGTTYGTSASSKIYLPCFGKSYEKRSKEINQEKVIKVLFGLDARETETGMSFIHDNRLTFKSISKDRNCSGAVMQMLVQGGATTFIRKPKAELYYTPLEVQNYARELQQYLEWINAYTDNLIGSINCEERPDFSEKDVLVSINTKLKQWPGAPRQIKILMESLVENLALMAHIKEQSKILATSLEFQGGQMSCSAPPEFVEIQEDKRRLAEQAVMPINLMKQAKILVEYLADELGEAPTKSLENITSPAKQAGLSAIIRMVNLIREELCSEMHA